MCIVALRRGGFDGLTALLLALLLAVHFSLYTTYEWHAYGGFFVCLQGHNLFRLHIALSSLPLHHHTYLRPVLAHGQYLVLGSTATHTAVP